MFSPISCCGRWCVTSCIKCCQQSKAEMQLLLKWSIGQSDGHLDITVLCECTHSDVCQHDRGVHVCLFAPEVFLFVDIVVSHFQLCASTARSRNTFSHRRVTATEKRMTCTWTWAMIWIPNLNVGDDWNSGDLTDSQTGVRMSWD